MKIIKLPSHNWDYEIMFCCELARAHKNMFIVKGGVLLFTICNHTTPLVINYCPFCGRKTEKVENDA